MDSTIRTFAQLARSVADKYVSVETIDASLQALGGKAEFPLSSLDVDRKSALISHFVRGLRNIGVHTASRIEHALLAAGGCGSAGRRTIVLKDAISLIAARNQVHQILTSLGMEWQGSMRFQSAISDVARFVIERGGGRIELEEVPGAIVCIVYVTQDLGPLVSTGATAPTWLASTLNLTKDVRTSRSGTGSSVEIRLPRPQAMVA